MKSCKKEVVSWQNIFEGTASITGVMSDAIDKYGFDGLLKELAFHAKARKQRKLSGILEKLAKEIKTVKYIDVTDKGGK